MTQEIAKFKLDGKLVEVIPVSDDEVPSIVNPNNHPIEFTSEEIIVWRKICSEHEDLELVQFASLIGKWN